MALERLTLGALARLDGGRLSVAFEREMTRALDDCRDRPGMDAARKVVLEVRLRPVSEGEALDSVDVKFRLAGSVPDRETKTYNMAADGNELSYNELSSDNARQRTLDMSTPSPTHEEHVEARRLAMARAAKEGSREVTDVG